MKILAIADRAPSENIKELVLKNQVDVICLLGDLDYFMLRDLEDIIDIPKLGVYGNHCSGNYFNQLGVINLHLQTFTHAGVVFGGFEGSIRYKESKYAKMYTQDEAEVLLKNFPPVDVFIAHSPPFGINDETDSSSHQGFMAIKDYLEKNQPKYFLHGHTYPSKEQIVTKHMNTNIIYVYGDKVIELE